MMKSAAAVVTDSGGVQEETSFIGIPCLIMRTTTERPICVKLGTAKLMGENYDHALTRLRSTLKDRKKKRKPIPLWDGRTAERIVSALVRRF
jgi:UDP-N-acetylglucosamine 2-epimerase (non-hydrolysing)